MAADVDGATILNVLVKVRQPVPGSATLRLMPVDCQVERIVTEPQIAIILHLMDSDTWRLESYARNRSLTKETLRRSRYTRKWSQPGQTPSTAGAYVQRRASPPHVRRLRTGTAPWQRGLDLTFRAET